MEGGEGTWVLEERMFDGTVLEGGMVLTEGEFLDSKGVFLKGKRPLLHLNTTKS